MLQLALRRALCALPATLLPLFAPAAAAQLDALPAGFPADSVRGEAAVARLADGLDALALAHGLSPAELRDHLRGDDTLWLAPGGRLFYVDPLPAATPEPQPQPPGGYAGGDTIPSSEAFNLASNPGADKTVYLDFSGHHSVSNGWGHDIQFPAFDKEGGPDTFTDSELQDIIVWWQRVTEDYAPFDCNVTTIEPPPGDLARQGANDERFGIRCVMTQPTDGFGVGVGGLALLSSFDDLLDNPCFVFNKSNDNGSMSASHEAGHTFGLVHDGLFGLTYHPGSGAAETSWGPIMGAAWSVSLMVWSQGDYPGATTSQDDIAVIAGAANGVNVVADDHGDDRFSASPVSAPTGCPAPAPGFAEGLIERRDDVDAFEFSTAGGVVTISGVPFGPGVNLDIGLTVQDASGATLASINDPDRTDAVGDVALSPGTYTVLVDGVGKPGEYSDYGSLGRYTLFVSPAGPDAIVDLGDALGNALGQAPVLQVAGALCAGDAISYELGLAAANAPAFLVLGFAELGLPFKGGVLIPDPAPPGAVVGLATSALGDLTFSAPWPAGVPGGLQLFLQYWVQDALGPAGFTASNGVRLTAP